MDNLDEFNEARKLTKAVIDTANSLNKLEGGALSATTAGFFVLGFIVGPGAWVLGAMSGGVLLYRAIGYYLNRGKIESATKLQLYDLVMMRKRALWESNLPDEEKKLLSEHLDSVLATIQPLEERPQLTTSRPRKQLKPRP